MPWVRIHDGAMRNLKIAALSDAAFRLWVAGLAHAQEHLTDGEIRTEHLKLLAVKPSPRALRELTTAVAENRAPLWDSTPDGYRIHDYAQWNETREVVVQKRAAKKERIARWRASRDGQKDAPRDALQNAPRDALGDAAPLPRTTTTSTPLKNLVGEGPPHPPRTDPIFGRRNPDLMTYGPVKLWASQFRDEIIPLVATHFVGDRDAADGPARAWIAELDEQNQRTTPSREAISKPAKWWSERAAERWGVAASAVDDPWLTGGRTA